MHLFISKEFEGMNRMPQKTDGVTAVVTPFLHFFSSAMRKSISTAIFVEEGRENPKKKKSFASQLPILCSQKPVEFPKSMKTREELTEYLTVIIFNASAQHAAVNFGQVSRRADVDQA